MIQLTLKEAQRFLVSYQGLDHYNSATPEKQTLEVFDKIGSIQYDPLNVVGRNPDLVLQARVKNYTPVILKKLLYEERTLIDGWDKMLSIYSITDFMNFQMVRQAMGDEMVRVLKSRQASDALEIIESVKTFLKENGPSQSTDMDFGKGGKGSWGHRKLSSASLDYLFHLGEVGVYNKKNTQKQYDLIENLLPESLLNSTHSFDNQEDFMMWYVLRRIKGIGLVWNKNGGGWLGHFISKKTLRTTAITKLMANGSIVECQIEGMEELFYMPVEGLDLLEAIRQKKTVNKSVRFIAPLDNLIWDRDMIEKLYNFKYRWEVYTPIKKRAYGYYVLPVLFGDRFIARVEFEQQRNNDPLIIKNWWWEASIRKTKKMHLEVHKSLKNFARYCGASSIEGLDIIDKSFD